MLPCLESAASKRFDASKADPRTKACPVIVITASGAAVFDEARDAGCAAFFCKPFNLFALDTVIQLLQSPGTTSSSELDSSMAKECSCGQVYSRQARLELPLCGRMFATDSANTTVELRNCACGSTLAPTAPHIVTGAALLARLT